MKTIGEYVHAHSQLPPEWLTVNLSQQIELRALGKITEMARGSLLMPTYIPINWNKTSNMTNSTRTDVAFGGP